MTGRIAGLVALLVSGCALVQPDAPMRLDDFSTDACSLFLDRSPVCDADWCRCCVEHDLAYWRGGPADARRAADERLQACVEKTTGSRAWSQLMYAGVRVGGTPYLPTWFRWGYGWTYGRLYRPLSPAEQADADAKERAYRATNPTLECPDRLAPARP